MGTSETHDAIVNRESRADVRDGLLRAALFSLRLGPALILLLLCVVVSLTTPFFFTSRNIGNVFSQTAVIAVLALGQLLVIITRGIDLSVGSTIALSSRGRRTRLPARRLVGARHPRDPRNGRGGRGGEWIVYVFGRVPHAFIVTLASLSIVSGIALWASNGSRSPECRTRSRSIGGGTIGWLPYSTFVVLGLALAALALMSTLVWGRWLYAVGGNPDAARRIGVPVRSAGVRVRLERPRRRSRRADHRRA